ncbi:hypothetical protein JCGZ_13750 [Jatropha curcas]|uniref:ENTH domain-containing protein n=1 Tax=Jatropha curcas TaxID=180498 RepID=A0A067K3X0_JATCU|nr:clathrin coat assembly protein AP180 [Jatropha curcas]KDP30807.1 hypothetical protein JCGZ_13750 [Jatropha curcas]
MSQPKNNVQVQIHPRKFGSSTTIKKISIETMPSKLRKAIGAVKDQTSISLAKVNNTSKSNLEVVILKATRHDEVPIEERYVKEILNLISSSKAHAGSCAQIIGRRIGKTRNWIVALKSLMLVLRIFQAGDPHFPKEVLHAMKRGTKILNLSTFRDDSNSSPWDYTAFVRTFALYLDERLDCFLTGKLQRSFSKKETRNGHHGNRSGNEPVCEMKPAILLDKICFWQKLLDRAISTRPTGAAKTNKLVLVSLYAVVQESFDLYRDISDGLALLLDSFFHLQYQSCVNAFQSCVKASKQFEELSSFYNFCKSLGVGRTSEYPSVQKISEELIETLQEFLKDQASFPTHSRSPPHLLLPAQSSLSSDDDKFQLSEDHVGIQERGISPSIFMERSLEQFDKQSDIDSASDSGSNKSLPVDQGTISATNSGLDLVSLEDWPPEDFKQEQEQGQENTGWEIVLAESATITPTNTTNQFEVFSSFEDSFEVTNNAFDQHSIMTSSFFGQSSPELLAESQDHHYNPFLHESFETPIIDTFTTPAVAATTSNEQLMFPIDGLIPISPTFRATPTFSAQDPEGALALNNTDEDDPFGPYPITVDDNGCDQQMLLHEQQLWLQHQDNIIAKNMS